MADCIIVLNAAPRASSSRCMDAEAPHGRLAHGQIEGIGAEPHLKASRPDGQTVERRWPGAGFDHHAALQALLALGPELLSGLRAVAVGHRVVHGGTAFSGPVRIDDGVLAALDALVPLAPLHQPQSIEAIRTAMQAMPHLPQIACFDTAFTTASRLWRKPSPCPGR